MARAKSDIHTLPLLGWRVERVEGVMDGRPVAALNSHKATNSVSPDGRRWVRKRLLDTGFEELLSEALAWMLAGELGVPVPHGATTGSGEDLSWLSERIPDVLHWHPSQVHYVENLDDIGRMLTLDAIIHNEDRHAGNILLQPQGSPVELKAWCIDCGTSRLGYPDDLGSPDLGVPQVKYIAKGLPVPRLRDGAMAAAETAQMLGKSLLRNMVDEACAIVSEDRRDLLLAALCARMARAPELATEYLALIESRQ